MNKRGNMEFSNMIILLVFLVIVSISGILAGVLYYDLNLIDNVFHTVNFNIPTQNNLTLNNSMTDFQDVLGVTLYPILGLRTAIPYLVYFMVFGLIIALGMSGYLSSKNHLFFILHILFLAVITYFSILLSNTYAQLLTQPFINQIMTPFAVYNKIMLYLPQILFFTGLLSGIAAFIGIIKPISNQQANQISLNYGGDY